MSMIGVAWRWGATVAVAGAPRGGSRPARTCRARRGAGEGSGGRAGGRRRTAASDGGDHPGEHVAILLDPALEPVAAALQKELGPGFAVVVWPPSEGDRGP
jgi:hypothetical protein